MGQLVEAALNAEVGAEGQDEDEQVGGDHPAGVIADQQHRALPLDVVQPAHVSAEIEAGQRPQPGQRLANVVGVALVEIGGGDEVRQPPRDRADRPGEQAASSRYSSLTVGHRASLPRVRLLTQAPVQRGPLPH